jgi:1,4-dihydroxy-2-naphthoate octaprenyltransferase
VAVCGTVFVQTLDLPTLAIWASLPVGSLATAILVVNNVRDRETDVLANKRTLAVRWGRQAGLYEYLGLVLVSYLVPCTLVISGQLGAWGLLPLASAPLGLWLVKRVFRDRGRPLNQALVGTAKLLLVYGLLLTLGLVLDARVAT